MDDIANNIENNNQLKNPLDAIKFAKEACELTDYKDPGFIDTLAVSYAAAGQFPEAVDMADKALELALSLKQEQLAEQIRKHLLLFKTNQPYIELLPKPVSN